MLPLTLRDCAPRLEPQGVARRGGSWGPARARWAGPAGAISARDCTLVHMCLIWFVSFQGAPSALQAHAWHGGRRCGCMCVRGRGRGRGRGSGPGRRALSAWGLPGIVRLRAAGGRVRAAGCLRQAQGRPSLPAGGVGDVPAWRAVLPACVGKRAPARMQTHGMRRRRGGQGTARGAGRKGQQLLALGGRARAARAEGRAQGRGHAVALRFQLELQQKVDKQSWRDSGLCQLPAELAWPA